MASASAVDFLVIIGALERSLVIALNEAARTRNICTSWSMSRGGLCYLLNDFLNFDLPTGVIQFSSFAEVFARDAAKSHRNALIKAFSQKNESNESNESSEQDSSKIKSKPISFLIYLSLIASYRLADAAIMGAVLSQEVIKFYSHKDAPINNLSVLDTSNLKNATAQI